MKYLLLKNGQIVSQQKLIKGDILIGNNRIMDIRSNIRIPSPDSMVIDVSGKYLLPGLLHYNCPFLETGNKENPGSSIYMALSHGSTFLMDTIRFKQDNSFNDTIIQSRENCKPIITDYSFHLGASSCSNITSRDLNYGFIHEGITSYYIKWKHIEKIIDGQLDHLLNVAAKYKLLIVCETLSIKQHNFAENPLLRKSYLEKINQLISILKEKDCPFLFMDMTIEEEIDTLFSESLSGLPIYASVNINCSKEPSSNIFSVNHIEKLWKNPNIHLSPPCLISSEDNSGIYIEHGRSPSFLLDIFGNMAEIPHSLLIKVCDMYSSRPARIFGIYPQKGVIEPGADADIIVWNPIEPDRSKTSGSNTSLLRKDISALIINGNVVTDDQLTAPNHFYGKFIQRNSLIPAMPAHKLVI